MSLGHLSRSLAFMFFLLFTGFTFSTFAYESHGTGSVPMVSDDPVVNQDMTPTMFEFITKTLSSNRMAPHLHCTLKTHSSRDLRKFSDRQEWVETLEVDFNTNGFDSGLKIKFKIPQDARYGLGKLRNQWTGVAEDIKVELGDRYGHYIRFAHDGRGQIVQIILGNDLKIIPCEVR